MATTSELDAAYRATSYCVTPPGARFALRIGCPDAAFDAWLGEQDVECYALITADNPASQALPEAVNAGRRQALLAAVGGHGWPHVATRSLAADGAWPSENGLCILGIERAAAAALGREFGQNAVVVGRRGAAPELLWLGEPA